MCDIELNYYSSKSGILLFIRDYQQYVCSDATVSQLIIQYCVCESIRQNNGFSPDEAASITFSIMFHHIWEFLFTFKKMTHAQIELLARCKIDAVNMCTAVVDFIVQTINLPSFNIRRIAFPVDRFQPSHVPETVKVLSQSLESSYHPIMIISALNHVLSFYDTCITGDNVRIVRQKMIAQIVCLIRHEFIRKRFDHYTTADTSSNAVSFTTPTDINALHTITIPLRILFPCMPTCARCSRYSCDKDFEVFNTACFVVGKRDAGIYVSDIKPHLVSFL